MFFDGGGFVLASAGRSSRPAALLFFAGFEWVDASYLAWGGGSRSLARGSGPALGDNRGDDCDAGVGDCACGMETLDAPLSLLGRGVGSGCNVFFTFVYVLLRRSRMDLSKTSSIAAARCGFSPDEVLRIVLESKATLAEGFSLDWKSSCSISLIRLWLCENYIRYADRRGPWRDLPRSEGGEKFLHDVVLV